MSKADKPMQVGIVGAGAIAYGAAAFLENAGHRASLWSPSGVRTRELASGKPLTARGAVEGEFHPDIAADARAAVADADVILIALPANDAPASAT